MDKAATKRLKATAPRPGPGPDPGPSTPKKRKHTQEPSDHHDKHTASSDPNTSMNESEGQARKAAKKKRQKEKKRLAAQATNPVKQPNKQKTKQTAATIDHNHDTALRLPLTDEYKNKTKKENKDKKHKEHKNKQADHMSESVEQANAPHSPSKKDKKKKKKHKQPDDDENDKTHLAPSQPPEQLPATPEKTNKKRKVHSEDVSAPAHDQSSPPKLSKKKRTADSKTQTAAASSSSSSSSLKKIKKEAASSSRRDDPLSVIIDTGDMRGKPKGLPRGRAALPALAKEDRKQIRRELVKWEAQAHSHRYVLINRALDYSDLHWLNKEIGLEYKKGAYSKQENEKLKRAVLAYLEHEKMSKEDLQEMLFNSRSTSELRQRHLTFIRQMSSMLDGRPNVQVRNRIKLIFHPEYRKGPWTPAEDEALKVAHTIHGPNWRKIGDHIGRLSKDCWARWAYLADHAEGHRLGPWTEQEVDELVDLVVRFREANPGTDIPWTAIAQQLGNQRHPRAYFLMFHLVRRRLAFEGRWNLSDAQQIRIVEQTRRERIKQLSDQLDEGIDEVDFLTDDFMQQNGFKGKADMEPDGWQPSVDDITLFQRYVVTTVS